jgi:hypothetical protein
MEVLANRLNTGAQGLSDLAVNNLITLDWYTRHSNHAPPPTQPKTPIPRYC